MNTPAAEPVPDWAKAKPPLGRMWDVHCIGLGSALALLAMCSVVSLLLSCKKKRFVRKPYVIAFNAFLLVLGATRAVFTFLDPYESHQKLRIWQAQLLFNISFPCLTSAFSLILYVFLSVAKLQLVSKNLQNVRFFIVVITIHFSIVICATILSIFKPSVATIVSLLSHVFYRLGLCSVSELHLRRLEHYISNEEDFKKSADAKADRRFQSCQSYSSDEHFWSRMQWVTCIFTFHCIPVLSR